MRASWKRRFVALGGAGVALAGTMIGTVGMNALPAGAAGPTVLTEFDCNAGAAGQQEAVPIIAGLAGTTVTPNPSAPTGSGVSVSGAAVFVVPGSLVAGLQAALGGAMTTVSISGLNATVSSPDLTATGSYNLSVAADSQPTTGVQVTGVTLTAGSTTLTGNFAGAAVGDSVASSQLTNNGDIDPATVITNVNSATSVNISVPVVTSAAGATIAFAAPATFTEPFSSGTVFTAAGTNGGTANFALTAVNGMTIGGLLAVGSADTPPGVCNLTGYNSGGTPATNGLGVGGAPLLPAAAYTAAGLAPLASVGPPTQAPTEASTGLVVNPPVALGTSANVGEGAAGVVIQLSASDAQPANSPALTLTNWTLVGTPSDPNLSVVINAANGQATLSNTDTSATSATFQFQVSNSGGATSAPATVTVQIGTPPVDQPLNENVSAGQLVLSCNAPGSAGYPETECPAITLPPVTLDGTQQTTAPTAMNTLFVSDNRGEVANGWSVTTYMVPTTTNPNLGCDAIADFCNSNAGSDPTLPVNNITAAQLAMSNVACAPYAGNNNPAPAAGPGASYAAIQSLCTAAAGTNGGSFTVDGDFSLTVPSSTAAGAYQGTVEYLVS